MIQKYQNWKLSDVLEYHWRIIEKCKKKQLLFTDTCALLYIFLFTAQVSAHSDVIPWGKYKFLGIINLVLDRERLIIHGSYIYWLNALYGWNLLWILFLFYFCFFYGKGKKHYIFLELGATLEF